MTRAMLEELSLVFALESCGPDPSDRRPAEHQIGTPDEDEAMRLAAIGREIRERAEALQPRALRSSTPRTAA